MAGFVIAGITELLKLLGVLSRATLEPKGGR